MKHITWLCVLVATAAMPLFAHAALGGNTASIETDQTALSASSTTTNADLYSVHTIKTAPGISIKEYLSPQGNVFAVAWQGPVLPDLRLLLGNYFQTYTDEIGKLNHSGGGPVAIITPDLVVQSGGHLRAFSGRAYLPQLLPEGITLDDIK